MIAACDRLDMCEFSSASGEACWYWDEDGAVAPRTWLGGHSAAIDVRLRR